MYDDYLIVERARTNSETQDRIDETAADSSVSNLSASLTLMAEKLSHDSGFDWLRHLSVLLGDIDQNSSSRDANALFAPSIGEKIPGSSADNQRQRLVDRYRVLVTVNATLTKALGVIRPRIAYCSDVKSESWNSTGQGLPRWQVRRARDFLVANLAMNISTADVAAACGLSRCYFISAFRRATGETPHLCLLRYRVRKAKVLLDGPMSIAEIALTCGFADQSHLTRIFAKHTGISPGAWRRERRQSVHDMA